ncbi:group XV phospholipase A2-like protein [Leptotrombidium deliense]|uniref:Group XV phospholipase A2-like protein n=1 Tax=Leptotrombidium deliense TaxID=299467 RepID=A0A443SA00_9ACAR|nr:group XV phospholipase A2-like protein [Leptotrombidium deliense]
MYNSHSGHKSYLQNKLCEIIAMTHKKFSLLINHKLVAGYMGNQLQYSDQHSFWLLRTISNSKWNLWFDVLNYLFFPKYWVEHARLYFSPKSKRSFSREGIHVEVPPMGSLNSMKYLAPFPQQLETTLYFNKLVEHLKRKGYKEGFDLYGAPHELDEHFVELKVLVESSYNKTGGKRVTLVGHSMGGNIAYIFLRNQTKVWKQKYIKALITIGTPWGGGFKYIYGFLHDDDYPANLFRVIREAERTYPSYTFLVPTKTIWNNTVLIETPSKNYTVDNLKEFFEKINNTLAYEMYEASQDDATLELKHPEVDVYCIGGLGFKTLHGLKYDNDNFSKNETVLFADGDTFVNKEALEGCLRWSPQKTNLATFNFEYKIFNADHLQLIRNDEPVDYLVKLITELKYSVKSA